VDKRAIGELRRLWAIGVLRAAPWPQRYAIAIGSGAAAGLVRLWIDPLAGDSAAFLFFAPAVLFTALLAGSGPGLVTTVFGAVAADYWFLPPRDSFKFSEPDDLFSMVLFALIGVLIVWLASERSRIGTERRLAEAEVAAANAAARGQAVFRQVLESAPDAVVTVDDRGRIVVINSQTEALFGYSRDELLGQYVEALLPDALREMHEHHRAAYLREPRTRPMGAGLELSARRKDGSEFPAEISLSPLQTPEGMLVTAVIRDTTEKRRMQDERARRIREQVARIEAEAAQKRSQFLARVSAVLSSSLDYEATLRNVARLVVPELADWCGVYLRKDDGRIEQIAVEHADPARAGWARELERRFPIDPEDPQGVANVIRAARSEIYPEIPVSLLGERVPDPELRRVIEAVGIASVMIVPLTVEGEVLGALTFVGAQESGRRYDRPDLVFAEELARRAGVAIENARLFRDAQEANRLKDEFLAVLSHELRTPLSAVLGWARMLASGRLEEDTARRAVEAIERNAEAQVQLINDLLDVSRIIAGKVQLEPREVSLQSVLTGSVDAVRFAADAKGVAIDLMLDPTAPQVFGDASRLQQVFWNLLSNAVKFTPRGGRVGIRLSRAESHLEVEVSDTGVGIRPGFLPYVFDRFRQGDSSTSRSRGGLGLGLAIVRHLIEMHGGTVRAESEGLGQGARFTVALPLPAVDRASAAPLATPARRGASRRPVPPEDQRLRGVDVLLVDDEPDARELIAAVLESEGATVRAVASVNEALEELRRARPAVLLTDIGLPGEDGFSLLKRLRALDGCLELPVVALTAYARPEDRRRVLAVGFERHLPKPVEPEELVLTVLELAHVPGESTRASADSRSRGTRRP
jgi:PAS domain S-box-containing protein